MLLKQMLEAPTTSSNLVVYDPFQPFDREALLKEVVGLANAKVDGPRNILFGVNPGAVNGNAVVGIPDAAVADLKQAHRLVSSMVEPLLHLAFVFDRVNGKLVGALEVDGCEFGPYFLAHDLSDELRRGSCWIRQDRELLEVERHELLNGHSAAAEEAPPALSPEDVCLSIGFNEDPDCEFVELAVPDTSDPPFPAAGPDANNGGETRKSTKLTQAIKDTVSTVTTQMLRIGQLGSPGDESEDASKLVAEAARKHYFYEERAVMVDLCIRNEGDVDVEDLSVELGFPLLNGFDVADRIYTSPFDKRSEAELKALGYPDVEHRKDSIIVRGTVVILPAEETQALFGTSLRLSVGPRAVGKKVAMNYVLRGPDGKRVGDGRLKIRLAQSSGD